MTRHAPRYCPFCHEAFESRSSCPAHELELVPEEELGTAQRPSEENEEAGGERAVGWLEPSMGRAWLAAGALLTVVAFFFSMVSLRGAVSTSGTLAQLAASRSGALWLVPLGGLGALSILVRRRSPSRMRSARLAALIVALVPVLAWGWTLHRIVEASEAMAERLGQPVEVSLGVGSYLVCAASALMAIGAFRFGRR